MHAPLNRRPTPLLLALALAQFGILGMTHAEDTSGGDSTA